MPYAFVVLIFTVVFVCPVGADSFLGNIDAPIDELEDQVRDEVRRKKQLENERLEDLYSLDEYENKIREINPAYDSAATREQLCTYLRSKDYRQHAKQIPKDQVEQMKKKARELGFDPDNREQYAERLKKLCSKQKDDAAAEENSN